MIIDVPNSGVALAVSQVAAQQEQGVHRLRRGGLRPDRAEVQRQHHPLDLRHLDAGERHRQGDGEDRRRHLVLPHRRLRLRPRARARHRGRGREGNGGKVLGKVRHPLNTYDFSSFLLQAQASKAKVIGLANAGGDTINSIKQASEFGIVKGGQKFAGLLVFASDVNALGLQTAQGLTLTETWYWDLNDTNRAWTKRWQAERGRRQVPDHDPGRRLFRHAALPQGAWRRWRASADGKAVVAQDEGDADRRSAVRQGHDPRRRPQAPRRVSVRGEEARRNPSIRATSTTCKATIPAAEAFRPLRTAAARWSAADLAFTSP